MLYLRRTILVAAIALVGLLVPTSQKSEGSELKAKMKTIAKKVAGFIKDKEQTTVALSEIIGPPDYPASSGPGIQTLLIAELKGEGVDINQKSALSIEGKFIILDDDNRKEE